MLLDRGFAHLAPHRQNPEILSEDFEADLQVGPFELTEVICPVSQFITSISHVISETTHVIISSLSIAMVMTLITYSALL